MARRVTKAGAPFREGHALKGAAEAEKESNKHVNAHFGYINSGAFLADAGVRAAEHVKLRTVRGTDYAGRQLKKYSPKYQKWKIKQGRYRGKVDLWLYGEMLNAIDFFRTPDPLRGYLIVRPHPQRAPKGGRSKITTRELARIHHRGEGHMPSRPFFSWRRGSPEDQRLIHTMRVLNKRYMQRVARGEYAAQGRAESFGASGRDTRSSLELT